MRVVVYRDDMTFETVIGMDYKTRRLKLVRSSTAYQTLIYFVFSPAQHLIPDVVSLPAQFDAIFIFI